jgi:hypothetical protein
VRIITRLVRRASGQYPLLVMRPYGGLANRMRCVVSAQTIAQLNGLRLVMLWEQGNHFYGEDWNDLFTDEIEHISPEYYREQLTQHPLRLSDWFEHVSGFGLKPLPSFDAGSALKTIRSQGMVIDEGFNSVISVFRGVGMKRLRRYRRLERSKIRRLGIHPSVLQRVNRFVENHYAGHEVIGFHIRRGDAMLGWEGDNPFAISSDEAFIRIMGDTARRRPRSRFYLATDCEETLGRFREQFPERIIAMEKTFVPSLLNQPKEGQQDALVEMLLLSRTSRIVGTNWSSYSQMAARIGGIRLDVAK